MFFGVFVDVETTGLSKYKGHRVVQIGLAYYDEQERKYVTREWLCNPGEKALGIADPDAMRINGISLDEIREATDAREVAKEVNELLHQLWLETPFNAMKIMSWARHFDSEMLSGWPWNFHLYNWGPCVKICMQNLRGKRNIHLGETVDWAIAGGDGEFKIKNSVRERLAELREKYHTAAADAEMAMHMWHLIQSMRRRPEKENQPLEIQS